MRLTAANEAARATRIGASEVAALLDCGHPYITKADVYARLVHGIRRPEKALLEMGHLMEETIFAIGKAKAEVPRARRNGRTYTHPTLPLAATPDGTVPGKSAIVEVKLVSHWEADHWLDGVPDHYMAQVQAQMLVTGKEWCHLWSLHGGTEVKVHLVGRRSEWQHWITAAVNDFMVRHVYAKVPPAEAQEEEWALTVTGLEGTVYADGDLLEYGHRLAALTAAEKAAKEAKEEARGAMALAMAAAGASVVVAPDWRAEAKPAPATGKVGLWFYPRKEKAA